MVLQPWPGRAKITMRKCRTVVKFTGPPGTCLCDTGPRADFRPPPGGSVFDSPNRSSGSTPSRPPSGMLPFPMYVFRMCHLLPFSGTRGTVNLTTVVRFHTQMVPDRGGEKKLSFWAPWAPGGGPGKFVWRSLFVATLGPSGDPAAGLQNDPRRENQSPKRPKPEY